MNPEAFISDLLHIDDGRNKLIDINGDGAFKLSHGADGNAAYFTRLIKSRIGKPANTLLAGSAAEKTVVTSDSNVVEWTDMNGTRDQSALADFTEAAYKDMALRGVNTCFVGIGVAEWQFDMGVKRRRGKSPVLMFPATLTRFGKNSAIHIGFPDEEIHVNPCFTAKIKAMFGDDAAANFPHPVQGVATDEPIDIVSLDIEEYFGRVADYLGKYAFDDGSKVFEFDADFVVVSRYSHDEICMYYDISHNLDKIKAHPLVRAIFGEGDPSDACAADVEPAFVLPKDSNQGDIIKEAVGGKSLIVKGPPGTGKTLTIANMIAALMSEGKTVLLASEKLAALSEVYAKLPENLRKFVMLLYSETEKQAAKLRPEVLRKDFSAILAARKNYNGKASSAALADMSHAQKDISRANRAFMEHYTRMFATPVAGRSYYDAIAASMENAELPVIGFCDASDALHITDEQYRALAKSAARLGDDFDRMTGGGAHSVRKCIWFDYDGEFDFDVESAYAAAGKIAKKIERVLSAGRSEGIGGDVALADVCRVHSCGLTRDGIESIAIADGVAIERLKAAIIKFDADGGDGAAVINVDDARDAAKALAGVATDGTVTDKQLKLIRDNYALVGGAACDGDRLIKLARAYTEKAERGADRLTAARAVFKDELTDDDGKKIAAGAKKLSVLLGDGKPNFIENIKAESAVKSLSKLSYLDAPTATEIARAAADYAAYLDCIAELEKLRQDFFRFARKKLSDEEIEALVEMGNIETDDINALIGSVNGEYDRIVECARLLCVDGYTVGELSLRAKAAIAASELDGALQALGLSGGRETAVGAVAARNILSCPSVKDGDGTLFVASLVELGGNTVNEICALLDDLVRFGETHFRNYYSESVDTVTSDELEYYVKECGDRTLVGAADDYFDGKKKGVLPLDRFFKPFEYGEREKGVHTFSQWFDRSLFALASAGAANAIGDDRNGMGDRVEKELGSRTSAERVAEHANATIIEGKCLERINPSDPDFKFLHEERNGAENLRRLFKNNGNAIFKLKKCFLLSPSTVSVLMRGDDFSRFDVVIVDEASQSEPTGLLPALMRSKQCVLVGDEWQMPPIRHFATVYEKTVTGADGEIEILDPTTSALGLALHNKAFDVRRFDCHYRSNTEALIAYSQARYYPDMHTFPAPVLIDDELGFTDISVDGYCEDGMNVREAEEAVKAVERHFDRYFDDKKGVLASSFGVVAFGIKQIDLIKRLVEKNAALNEKLNRAIQNFGDVAEKLAFFKTIETVQGRETEHMILSLTYGRRKGGEIEQSFGELNRSSLGQCIFNVAVTRAKSSITVLHSIEAEDITNENIKFIRDYLTFVRMYCGAHIKEQFTAREPENAFIRAVGEEIVACGVARERVVYGYGGTKGSVRIPIAVMSADGRRAELGVLCESVHRAGDDYYDCNEGRINSLIARGWHILRVYAHDFSDNGRATRERIAKAVEKYVK